MFLYPNKPIRFRTLDALVEAIDLRKWIVQPKWDGVRILIHCDLEGNVTAWSRHKRVLPESAELEFVRHLPLPRPFYLDGELIRKTKRIVIWDAAILGGRTMLQTAYEDRLQSLQKALAAPMIASGWRIEAIESYSGKEYKKLCLRRGELEGLVFKDPSCTGQNWGLSRTCEHPSQLKFLFA